MSAQVPPEAVARAVSKIEDLLCMLGLDPDERDEDGVDSRTTAEVIATAVLNGGAGVVVATELRRIAAELPGRWSTDDGYRTGRSDAYRALLNRAAYLSSAP